MRRVSFLQHVWRVSFVQQVVTSVNYATCCDECHLCNRLRRVSFMQQVAVSVIYATGFGECFICATGIDEWHVTALQVATSVIYAIGCDECH